jgi:hypothetical protein
MVISRNQINNINLGGNRVKKLSILLLISMTALVLTACSKDEPAPQAVAEKAPAVEPTQPIAVEPTQPAAPSGITGAVVETMNAAGYTYVQVDDGKEKIWAAAPQFSVSVGDQVMVPEGMAMHNYHSQSLDRDFPVVYFVESVLNASNPAAAAPMSPDMQMPEGHPPISGAEVPSAVDLTNVAKVDGGLTVAEIYNGKADLSGKEVTLRGKVVKFSPQIMGTNWIHLQDGTGDQASGSNDLTITSSMQVKVGETIVATGPLTLDKDFGYGYKYDLIMENAAITAE